MGHNELVELVGLICAAFQYESCVRLSLWTEMFHTNKCDCFQLTPRLTMGEWANCSLVCSLQSRQLSAQRSSEVVLWVVLVKSIAVVVCGWCLWAVGQALQD